jgi:hypothetical protein
MNRRTAIVEGPLAVRMARLAAARRADRRADHGLPQLAAWLAHGFIRPARSQDLDPAIGAALDPGGFVELEQIRRLPGMVRSVAGGLAKVWQADLSLQDLSDYSTRFAGLPEIERRGRANLAKGTLTPRDLRDAALQRATHTPVALGPIELDRLIGVAPVWRSLAASLAKFVPLSWRSPGATDTAWFPGQVIIDERLPAAGCSMVSCANPRAEVVEALRWTREFIASGRARSEDIAICATNTDEWDTPFLALPSDAPLLLHFLHGLPILASREGQAFAAPADVLLNGLSRDRVPHLFGHAAGHATFLLLVWSN